MASREFQHIQEIIAPPGVEVTPNYLHIGTKFVKTIFILTYPRYLSSGWFNDILNAPRLLDVAIFLHPMDTAIALKNLRNKAGHIEAEIFENEEKGMVRDPVLETALQDIETLRDALQQARERLFNVGVYITIYSDTREELAELEEKLNDTLEGKLVYVKPALFRQTEGFNSTLPIGLDELGIQNPLDSGPASSIFPFISADLTAEDGILYGINAHNNTLVIFDRFSLENANMVIFAKSGAGKSYAAKLEIIRSLMTGSDVLVIDPENEYQTLAESLGGSFFKISLSSDDHINPFDIPAVPEGEDPEDTLRSHIVAIAGLIKVMLKDVTPEEEAVLDRAITETYASHDIIVGKDFSHATPPLLEDLRTVLEGMEGGRPLAERLYRFTQGSFAGFLNHPTSIDIKNRLIVFSVRDLDDELRPIAMYVILNFIWNLIRSELKKRLIFLDEAWWMMRYEDSAKFLFGLVKRARKYYLGVTTITQDVEDFILSPYGRPIITNSSLQILLRQAPGAAGVDIVAKTFNLTEAEKNLLLEAGPQAAISGLFFAGLKHVAIKIISSYFEHQIITTNPEELLRMRKEE